MAGLSGGAGPAAIIVLAQAGLATARRIQRALPRAVIYGLAARVTGTDVSFVEFGVTLGQLFADDVPVVALCAAGIVIRTLAPVLRDKRAEPPVLAVAEDGSAVVPLLGGLRGVNTLARAIGAALGTAPAITTTGEIRFGAALEHPPEGYELRNPEAGKQVMSDLLAGEQVRLSGAAPWLAKTRLPFHPAGRISIVVTPYECEPGERELVFHPRSVAVGIAAGAADLPRLVSAALARYGLAPRAVGLVVAAERDVARPEIHAAAAALARPLRFVADAAATLPPGEVAASLVAAAVPEPVTGPFVDGPVALAVAAAPIDPATIGRARGRLAVVGLGPGMPGWLAPEAHRELAAATDIVGYAPYIAMAGRFAADQAIHMSDNREEMHRARQALSLAASGRSVAVVSSGDPGVFAMATAVLEALHGSADAAWHGVDLVVIPGISAAHAAAARAGAPLGHDFCVLSLSDNLKPWAIVERRLDLAAAADLAVALYNPVSRARPWQFARAVEIIRRHRDPATPVVLGHDVGRLGEMTEILSLDRLASARIDMRTIVIIGSSTTRTFSRLDGGLWAYTPRWYPNPAEPPANA